MNPDSLAVLGFKPIEKAEFLDRPNRFLIRCRTASGEKVAFLPNPGRLRELLLPGRIVYLSPEDRRSVRKYPYTVIAVEREGRPILLHTHRTNAVAEYLIERSRVPGLEGARVLGKEVRIGRSRFDLLLEQGGREILTEVKSCTLVGEQLAMFPDAVTERGTRHLRELGALNVKGREAAMLFIVHWPKAKFFLPDYHTDLVFARTLLDVREKIRVFPIAIGWKDDLSLEETVKVLTIPWEVLKREARDQGSYLLILKLEESKRITVGKLGTLTFRPGYYCYIGSAMDRLSTRLARHRRLRKRKHWHIDYFRGETELRTLLPIRASERLECSLAGALGEIAEWTVPGFGCSDCRCHSHLFGMNGDPWRQEEFIAVLQYFRMDRLFPTGSPAKKVGKAPAA